MFKHVLKPEVDSHRWIISYRKGLKIEQKDLKMCTPGPIVWEVNICYFPRRTNQHTTFQSTERRYSKDIATTILKSGCQFHLPRYLYARALIPTNMTQIIMKILNLGTGQ